MVLVGSGIGSSHAVPNCFKMMIVLMSSLCIWLVVGIEPEGESE